MGMASVGTLFNVVSRLAQGAELMTVLPQLVMSSTMMAGTFLWPYLTSKYEKKMIAQNIKDMTAKYKEYIETKRRQIALIGQGQRDSLLDNNVSLNECESIIKSRNRRLWERDLSHNDFLNLRLGLGNKNIELEIDSSGGDSNSDGDLANYMNDMISTSKILYDVPITESLIRKNVIAIEGKKLQSREFINNLILQMITFHSYRDLKIIIFSSEENKENNYNLTQIFEILLKFGIDIMLNKNAGVKGKDANNVKLVNFIFFTISILFNCSFKESTIF